MNYRNNRFEIQNPFNVNDLPYIKNRSFDEIKCKYYQLHTLAYDSCIDVSFMLHRIDYILDYIMKNFSELGKKEIKQKLKELEFYTKKPLKSFIELDRLVVCNFNRVGE